MAQFGSSPLTRGTPVPKLHAVVGFRFIPAYAGNSFWLREIEFLWMVHPRLRGELQMASNAENSMGGSSPLTRGTRCVRKSSVDSHRFIPAYAGNSLKDGINPSIHTLGI